MIISNGSILVSVTTPAVPAVQVPAQVKDFGVYYTRSPDDPCGAGVCMTFYPLDGSPVTRFAVFRSIIGFEVDLPGLSTVAGKTLQVSVNMGPTQEILFDGVTPIVEQLDSITGGYAVLSEVYPQKAIVRVDGGSSPGMMQILGGTALGDLGLTPGTITKNSHDYLIAYLDRVSGDVEDGIEYCDFDGTIWDSYAIATVDNQNNISFKTSYQDPQQTTGKVCCVYGTISDVSGARIPDVEIQAKVLEKPQSVAEPVYIDTGIVNKAYSDHKGDWEICVLQGALVELKIEALSFYRILRIPDAPRAPVSEIPVDRDYRYPLEV